MPCKSVEPKGVHSCCTNSMSCKAPGKRGQEACAAYDRRGIAANISSRYCTPCTLQVLLRRLPKNRPPYPGASRRGHGSLCSAMKTGGAPGPECAAGTPRPPCSPGAARRGAYSTGPPGSAGRWRLAPSAAQCRRPSVCRGDRSDTAGSWVLAPSTISCTFT